MVVNHLWGVIAAIGLVVLAAACVNGATESASAEGRALEDGGPLVVATFSVIGDLVEAVAGQHARVETIVPVGADPHGYQPVPSDVGLISDADVVFDNGLGLSPWFEPLRGWAGGDIVDLSSALRDEALDAYDGVVDPHMWLSPSLTQRYVVAIAQALAEVVPDHADRYAANAIGYREQLEVLDEELHGWVATIPEDARKLVTYEDAFNYFAGHFGFEILATAVGPTTEEEPSAERIRMLVDRVRATDIPAIFVEELVDGRVIERAAADAGVELASQELFVDSLGQPGSGAETYIDMMRLNMRTIVNGLDGRVDGE